jgi:hypothetical protein
MHLRRTTLSSLLAVLASLAMYGPSASAQSAPAREFADRGVTNPAYPRSVARREPDSRQEVIARMCRRVTVVWEDAPLEAVLAQLGEALGMEIVPMWAEGSEPATSTSRAASEPATQRAELMGLRRGQRVTQHAENITLLRVLERVLEDAEIEGEGGSPSLGNTWQLSTTNRLQVGPRERLNRWKRTDTYDVTDLLLVIKDWTERVNGLASIVGKNGFEDRRTALERAEDLRETIMSACEPESWVDLGGSAATIRFYLPSKAMVVRAPDYVHRAIGGYRWDAASHGEIGDPAPPQRQAPRVRSETPTSASN